MYVYTVPMKNFVMLMVLAILCKHYNAASKEDDEKDKDPEERLLDTILDVDRYDKRVRPLIFDENGTVVPLIVNVTFSLYTFIDMNEIMEAGYAYMFIWEKWWDPRLAWDPEEYGGADLITLEVGDVWIPDVFLYELTTGQNDDKGQKTHLRVQAVRQGDKFNAEVTLPYAALLIERCPMQMLHYPFDQQTCRFCIGAMASTNSQIIFHADPQIQDQHHSTIGGEWMLIKAVGVDLIYREFSICCADVTVKRRSAFFGLNLFFPTIAVCLLNTVGLFSRLEEDHTQVDIANVGQTTLLNLGIIMLTIAAEETPRGAIISFLGLFFMIMIAQSLSASVTAMYLRQQIIYRERRALRMARRQAKAVEKSRELLSKLGSISPGRKPKIFAVTGDVPVFDARYFYMKQDYCESNGYNETNQMKIGVEMKPKLIRWERICMWVHVCFIATVTVIVTIVGVILSPPAFEWQTY